jgi:hypothetical protein
MTAPAAPLRSSPGTALCLASGILAFMSWWIPPLPFFFGVFCLFNAWRASRSARLYPERYRSSAVPLTGVVLVILAWTFATLVLLIIGAASGEMVHPEAPSEERW